MEVAMRSAKDYVSRPSGGLVNLPHRLVVSQKELNVSKWFLAIAAFAIAALTFASPSQVTVSGGNGGLVNLPGGGGGFSGQVELGLQKIYTAGAPLNPWHLKVITLSFNTEGETVVLGFYEGSLIQATFDGFSLEYQATLQATINPPGTKYVTRYTCRCCNREQEITTDCGGSSNYQFYSDEHDKAVKVRLKSHPEKKAEPVPTH